MNLYNKIKCYNENCNKTFKTIETRPTGCGQEARIEETYYIIDDDNSNILYYFCSLECAEKTRMKPENGYFRSFFCRIEEQEKCDWHPIDAY